MRSTSDVFHKFDGPFTDTAIEAKCFIQGVLQTFMALKAELIFQNNSLLGIIILNIRGCS